MARINDEESFLIQAHALVECLVKLGKLEANKESFCIDNIDKIYGQAAKLMAEKGRSVFQGQGVLMGVFYMFLVLPLEWKKKNVGDFRKEPSEHRRILL